jgi:hypothetical protein
MRARDYDSQTGLFLSRDPVDVQQQGVEAFNPYQFAFNNPLVYSDPTGMFTLIELNTTQNIQGTLRGYAQDQAFKFLEESTKRVFSTLAKNAIEQVLPTTTLGGKIDQLITIGGGEAGGGFENFIKGSVCTALPSGFNDWLWITPEVTSNGKVTSPGFNCGKEASLPGNPTTNPDFIIEKGNPSINRRFNPNSYLIGDIKITAKAVFKDIKENEGQWQAIFNHAKQYQSLHMASYIVFKSNVSGSSNPQQIQAEFAKIGIKKGIILFIAILFE